MSSRLNELLTVMKGLKLSEVVKTEFDELELYFSNDFSIFSCYWRFFGGDGSRFSSFDHNQKYGLLAPYDSYLNLQKNIQKSEVVSIEINERTKDVEIKFNNNCQLDLINVTANEIWQINWPDGRLETSNYQ